MEQFANNATTALSGAIDSIQTTITVVSATGFSPDNDYRIRIDSELMLVTGGASTTTWTVTRGIEGTVANSHSNAAVVFQVLTAGALQQFRADNAQSDATLNIPAASTEGVLFFPNNGLLFYRDTGTEWQTFGPIWRFTPPVIGDFTWFNQGSATAVETNGGITLTAPANAGINIRCFEQALPTPPYTWTVAFRASMSSANYSNCGILTRDSTSGQLWAFTQHNLFGQIAAHNFTDVTTFSASILSEAHPCYSETQWMQVADDGTTTTLRLSRDGFNWINFTSFLRDAFVPAPDRIGVLVDSETASHNAYITLLHWEIT